MPPPPAPPPLLHSDKPELNCIVTLNARTGVGLVRRTWPGTVTHVLDNDSVALGGRTAPPRSPDELLTSVTVIGLVQDDVPDDDEHELWTRPSMWSTWTLPPAPPPPPP